MPQVAVGSTPHHLLDSCGGWLGAVFGEIPPTTRAFPAKVIAAAANNLLLDSDVSMAVTSQPMDLIVTA